MSKKSEIKRLKRRIDALLTDGARLDAALELRKRMVDHLRAALHDRIRDRITTTDLEPPLHGEPAPDASKVQETDERDGELEEARQRIKVLEEALQNTGGEIGRQDREIGRLDKVIKRLQADLKDALQAANDTRLAQLGPNHREAELEAAIAENYRQRPSGVGSDGGGAMHLPSGTNSLHPQPTQTSTVASSGGIEHTSPEASA